MEAVRERHTRGTPDFPLEIYKFNITKKDTVTVGLHFHTEIEILYVKKGAIKVHATGEEIVLSAGNVCFINPEEPHTITTAVDDTYYMAMVFSPSLINFNVGHFFNEEFVTPLLKGKITLPRIVYEKEIIDIVEKIFSVKSKSLTLANLMILFSFFLENSMIEKKSDVSFHNKHTEEIKKVIEYMQLNCVEKLTLSSLADILHFSDNYFCSFFKKYTGMTVFEYLNHLRIQKACELLRTSENPISEIAEKCGFESASFFIRKFKEIQSCTPRQYRESNSGKSEATL